MNVKTFFQSVYFLIFFIIVFLITFFLLILHKYSSKFIFLSLILIKNLLDNYIQQNDLSSISKIK